METAIIKKNNINIFKKFFAFMFMLLLSFSLNTNNSFANPSNSGGGVGSVNIQMSEDGSLNIAGIGSESGASVWTTVLGKYKTIIVGFSGIGMITMIGVFIMNFMKLGTTSANPSERAKVTQALIWSGLAAAGLGSVVMIVGFFYNSLT